MKPIYEPYNIRIGVPKLAEMKERVGLAYEFLYENNLHGVRKHLILINRILEEIQEEHGFRIPKIKLKKV